MTTISPPESDASSGPEPDEPVVIPDKPSVGTPESPVGLTHRQILVVMSGLMSAAGYWGGELILNS